jgi:protein phosphatase
LFSTSGTTVITPHHRAPAHRVHCAGATDPGRQRAHNEDRFGVFPEIGLFIVADGMGGAAAGEVAARMVVELVCEPFVDAEATWPRGTPAPGGSLPARLVAAIQRASLRIHNAALSRPAWQGMGSTVVALLAHGQRAALAHVGDSRIYRLRERRLQLLTEDHSLFNEMVRAGLADPDHPENFAHPNVITRAVGIEPAVEVDARLVEVMPGDTFLLCSDGLSGVVSAREMVEILGDQPDLDVAAEQLIRRANQHGGPDNITAVALRWDAAGDSHRARA